MSLSLETSTIILYSGRSFVPTGYGPSLRFHHCGMPKLSVSCRIYGTCSSSLHRSARLLVSFSAPRTLLRTFCTSHSFVVVLYNLSPFCRSVRRFSSLVYVSSQHVRCCCFFSSFSVNSPGIFAARRIRCHSCFIFLSLSFRATKSAYSLLATTRSAPRRSFSSSVSVVLHNTLSPGCSSLLRFLVSASLRRGCFCLLSSVRTISTALFVWFPSPAVLHRFLPLFNVTISFPFLTPFRSFLINLFSKKQSPRGLPKQKQTWLCALTNAPCVVIPSFSPVIPDVQPIPVSRSAGPASPPCTSTSSSCYYDTRDSNTAALHLAVTPASSRVLSPGHHLTPASRSADISYPSRPPDVPGSPTSVTSSGWDSLEAPGHRAARRDLAASRFDDLLSSLQDSFGSGWSIPRPSKLPRRSLRC